MDRTHRGFMIYKEFNDTKGTTVRVQRSSAATFDACWIFCESEMMTDPAPHLNRRQAWSVIVALLKFIIGVR